MFKIRAKEKTFYFLLFTFLILARSLCAAGTPDAIKDIWDPAKYISIDEIQPGMKAYCLTCYSGTKIEKFDLDVISVIRNYNPGRDTILVQGTDERFIHTGPVWGCSGSPVYIDGRLAGALAVAWTYSKDPLYGVTPIEEMLCVGRGGRPEKSAAQRAFVFDFSRPIDFAEIDRQITTPRLSGKSNLTGAVLPFPLITSGLPAQVAEQLNALVKPFGLAVISGVGGGVGFNKDEDIQLAPGACLVVPFVTGDITMEAIGTATEIIGDKVYAFGHGLDYGQIDLPMATGQVHTVRASVARSVKLASAIEIVGALTEDEAAGVFGRIGAKAKMIPLKMRIDRYNDTERRVYNCRLAYNRLLTPMLLRSVIAGAALYLGDLPPDHMIEYKVAIGLEDAESITFDNVSTTLGLAEMIAESVGSFTLLMNNPYKEIDIKSLYFDVRIAPKNIVSHIWSVDLSDSKVKAGRNIDITVVVESVRAEKKKYRCSLKVPDDLPPGRYDLTVCGSSDYERFLMKTVPYRFVAQSLPSLIEAISNSLQVDRDRLYCLLLLPPGGVLVEKAELPGLPPTKALVLKSAKRTLKTRPYPNWLENTVKTGTIVIDKKVLRITVEK
ncbi:MAG: SpoIVB peptidase S55 domain-containing protein [Planctomycetota bacterium]|jgi:hypothetical protein